MLGICKACGAVNRIDANTALEKKPICGKCKVEVQLHDLTQEVDTEGFYKVLRNAKGPVVVDFWASWCGPCKVYGPVFQATSREYPNKVQFLKINTEEEQQFAANFGIRGIPATLIFENGKVKDSISGALNSDQLKQWINKSL